MKTLDAAYMDAVSQSLTPKRTATLPIFSQQVERSAAGLSDTIEPLRHAAKYEAENIGNGEKLDCQSVFKFGIIFQGIQSTK